mmetsp:Transcript_26944/g.33466  ORF Transcript_26944/g.33466 Transcript_26944/m.33466 type:complete len:81 (-) Transcript_26944:39-281(-)
MTLHLTLWSSLVVISIMYVTIYLNIQIYSYSIELEEWEHNMRLMIAVTCFFAIMHTIGCSLDCLNLYAYFKLSRKISRRA